MIIIILILIAAILNAAMDTMKDHFSTSIFKDKDPKFWDAYSSWKYAKKVLGYPLDGWHIAKSVMIICFVIAIYGITWMALIMGVVWNLVFLLFYEIIFKRDK